MNLLGFLDSVVSEKQLSGCKFSSRVGTCNIHMILGILTVPVKGEG